jgi:hypothetical protein
MLQDKVTGTIPSAGGSLLSTGGETSFAFPGGAFDEAAIVTYGHLWTDQKTGGLAGIGHTYDLAAVDADTEAPVQLASGQIYAVTVRYTQAEVGPAIEETLALYSWEGNQWVKEPSSVLDTANNQVTATPNHLSLWAVLGETRRVFLPIVSRNN